MRKYAKHFLGLAGLLTVALTSVAHAQDTPAKGGTLNMILQPEPPMLMLGLNSQGPTIFAGGQIYQSLLSYAKDLTPQPSLAKTWEVSADGLTYTFTLQDNVKWHDGKPFTAGDVVFTADKFLREAHPRWRYIANTYVESITAPAANQVVFKLKTPFSAFLYAFEVSSFPVVPKHIYDGTDYRTNPANQTPIGTGPFKFKEWQRGSYVHLVRNEDYWKPGKPLLDDLYFRIIPDSASRAVAFEQGTVDVLRGGDVEGFEVRRLAKLPDVETTTDGWEMYSPLSFMLMNLRKAPFDNKLVRQAVMHAIDRNFVAKTVFFGQGIPATGPLASTTQFYTKDTPTYTFDIEKAKALIAESGVNVGAEPIRLMPMPYGSQWDRLAEYMKQQLEQVGFQVAIQSVDAGGWSQALSDWNFDLSFNFTYQYGHPALGVARHYLSANIIKGTPFANNEGYSNPKVDELLAAGASAVKPEDAAAAYAEMQKIATDDVALGWMLEMKNTTISKSKVKGLVRSAIGLNEALEEAWIAK
ncbi:MULTISPECIES: ABC transporter substrate-binding protein [unclassified Ensifer]|uniref:ABC transporter substrate-binding protein n=1 Tax=unclassified Ensifer TaxID=2633371 RepID=UPI000813D65E|nr:MULTISPECIES: ABC transporter substrate-binding protein [unclassified Ensifer]OCP21368.1 peptide ABC transporter substrate-binding protein [Ensifer sp. LC384]OCP22402.1 peptide ABC transporter substrate-binding protein [Ensifer sp. LC54]